MRVHWLVFVTLFVIILASSVWIMSHSNYTATEVGISDVRVEITTTKDVYHVGDEINATVWFVNPSDRAVILAPITRVNINGNYVNTTNPVSAMALLDYVSSDASIRIGARGRIPFLPLSFQAVRPGRFVIECFGVSKLVDVI